jgi:hypothetical protein
MKKTRHFGMFQFKDEINEEQIKDCFEALMSMVGKIPGLLKIEHGPYDSSEGLNDGYTHGFIMTFDSPESRELYLPHPIHEAVKDILVPKLERVVVFDFNF